MLSHDQVKHLFQFCEKHYVRHYDVQIELVDHLSNAIEELLEKEPTLDFEIALDKVYRSFGFKGFGNVVEEKQRQLLRQEHKDLWRYFKDYFTFPQISLTLLTGTFLLAPAFVVEISTLMNWLIFLVALYAIVSLTAILYFYASTRKPVKSILSLNASLLYSAVSLIFNVPLQLLLISRGYGLERVFASHTYTVAILIFLIVIIFTAAGFNVYKSKYNNALQKYPEAFALPH